MPGRYPPGAITARLKSPRGWRLRWSPLPSPDKKLGMKLGPVFPTQFLKCHCLLMTGPPDRFSPKPNAFIGLWHSKFHRESLRLARRLGECRGQNARRRYIESSAQIGMPVEEFVEEQVQIQPFASPTLVHGRNRICNLRAAINFLRTHPVRQDPRPFISSVVSGADPAPLTRGGPPLTVAVASGSLRACKRK